MQELPLFIDTFLIPVRDSQTAQVAIAAVLILILLDIVFGIGNALASHTYSSEKMRQGIGHKCTELGFMLVGVVVDGTIAGGFDLGYTAPVLTAICAYLCIMEIGSLLETFALMNPQLAGSAVFKLLESTHIIEEEGAAGFSASVMGERDDRDDSQYEE